MSASPGYQKKIMSTLKKNTGVLQVRCTMKKKPNHVEPTAASHIEVLTWNAYELPYAATSTGQMERTCRIPRVHDIVKYI